MQAELEQILLTWSVPFMAFFIILEMAYSAWRERGSYQTRDTFHNLLFTSLNFGLDLAMRGASLAILSFFYALTPLRWEAGWAYWIALFFAQDLAYYVLHCADHHVRFFWATHVTHHNSEQFNLTVSIRSSVFQPLYRFAFYIPLALAGFAPLHIVFMYAACQVYGFWVHTETINKMPAWFEFFLVTPSHHRVHHASNVQYLDRNMGMVLIIWDRLFGTFTAEAEKPNYGLTYRIERPRPLGLIFGEWGKLLADLRQARGWRQRLRYLVMPPGWSPDGSSLTSRQLRELQNAEMSHSPEAEKSHRYICRTAVRPSMMRQASQSAKCANKVWRERPGLPYFAALNPSSTH